MKTKGSVVIEFRIAKDESGNDKFKTQFIIDELLNGNAIIQKGDSCSFIVSKKNSNRHQIMAQIESAESCDVRKMASSNTMYTKKLKEKVDRFFKLNQARKRHITQFNNFIRKMIQEGRVTKDEVSEFVKNRKENGNK